MACVGRTESRLSGLQPLYDLLAEVRRSEAAHYLGVPREAPGTGLIGGVKKQSTQTKTHPEQIRLSAGFQLVTTDDHKPRDANRQVVIGGVKSRG